MVYSIDTSFILYSISIFVNYKIASDSLSLITLIITIEMFIFPILSISFHLNFLF